MLKIFFIPIFLFLSLIYCNSQVSETFLTLDKKDLPEGRFNPARTFTGASLFGYIDGGAELYLEYGFSSVWVTEIGLMSGKYKTEIYRMNGPEEAFGIFSVSKYKCKSMPDLSLFACQTRYQLQICAGSFYISIINVTGSKTDSIASLRIGEAIIKKIREPSADISAYLPGVSDEIISSNAILAKGKLGIINGAPDWEDYFKNATGYSLVVLSGNEKTTLSLKFRSKEDLSKFVSLHRWDLESITTNLTKLLTGESVRKLSDVQLLIEIPK